MENNHDTRLFLLGEAVECEGIEHPEFDVPRQMVAFVQRGGMILACGTCLRNRKMEGTELCPVSTMQDLVDLVVWADRVVNF